MKTFSKNNRLLFLASGLFIALALFFVVLSSPATTRAFTIQPIYKVLTGEAVKNGDSDEIKAEKTKVLATSNQIKSIWNSLLTFVNSIAIVMLIFIAFANILRINISTYGVKKFLPALAMAIIAANFSYLFCRIMVDFSNVACALFIQGTTASSGATGIAGGFDFTEKVVNFQNYPSMLILTILEFIGTVFIIIVTFLLIIRIYMIYFLVALSPLTIVCIALPMTKSVFNMWWQQFWKWTFMPVVVLFWLWLGGQWVNTVIDKTNTGSIIIGFAFAIVCYYLAITTPQKMGQGVMTSWNNLGKWGWGKTGGNAWNATGGAASKAIKEGSKAYYDRQKGFVQERLFDTRVGRNIRQRQADFRLRNEVPGMMKEKAMDDARKRAALLQLGQRTHAEWGQIPGGRAIQGRLIGITRKGAQDEHQSSRWAAGTTAEVANDLIINNAGQLATPHDIINGQIAPPRANATPAQIANRNRLLGEMQRDPLGAFEHSSAAYIELTKRANQRNHPGHREAVDFLGLAAGAVRGYPNGAPPGNYAGMIVPRGADPGFGMRAVSAVGRTVANRETGEAVEQTPEQKMQHSKTELAQVVGSPETADKLATEALHGGKNITVLANEMNVTLSPDAQKHFNALRGQKDELVAEEKGEHGKQIEDIMTGAKIVYDQATQGADRLSDENISSRIAVHGKTADNGLRMLTNKNIQGAFDVAKGFGFSDISMNDLDINQKLENRLTQIKSGAKALLDFQPEGGALPRKWEEINDRLLKAKTARASEKSEVTASARFIAEDHQFSPELIAKLGNTTVGDALGAQSEHLAGLTSHINELAKLTAEARKMTPVTFTQPQTRGILSGVTAGVPPSMLMTDYMSSGDGQKKFARILASEMVKANRNAGPNRNMDGVQKPEPTVINNTTVNQPTAGATVPPSTAVPPRENPLPPPPPNKPPTTPSPIRPPETPAP